jgi:hypothetical protein
VPWPRFVQIGANERYIETQREDTRANMKRTDEFAKDLCRELNRHKKNGPSQFVLVTEQP